MKKIIGMTLGLFVMMGLGKHLLRSPAWFLLRKRVCRR